MIECKLLRGNPKTVRLQIRGHETGPQLKGPGLVCEDVSALWCTLMAVAVERGWKGTIRNDPGDCEIEVELNKRNRQEVFLCLSVITAGLRMIEKAFPETVRYREDRGKDTDTLRAKDEE